MTSRSFWLPIVTSFIEKACRHKMRDPLPKTVTSFMDDPK